MCFSLPRPWQTRPDLLQTGAGLELEWMDNGGPVFWENVKLVWTGTGHHIKIFYNWDSEIQRAQGYWSRRDCVGDRMILSLLCIFELGHWNWVDVEATKLFCCVLKCCESWLQKPGTWYESGVMASVVPAGGWQTSGGHGAVQRWYSGKMSHQRGGCGQAATQLGYILGIITLLLSPALINNNHIHKTLY